MNCMYFTAKQTRKALKGLGFTDEEAGDILKDAHDTGQTSLEVPNAYIQQAAWVTIYHYKDSFTLPYLVYSPESEGFGGVETFRLASGTKRSK